MYFKIYPIEVGVGKGTLLIFVLRLRQSSK